MIHHYNDALHSKLVLTVISKVACLTNKLRSDRCVAYELIDYHQGYT